MGDSGESGLAASTVKPALPGDICLLLVPTKRETAVLHARQVKLHALFGGEIVDEMHITCQRFNFPKTVDQPWALRHLQEKIASEKSFMVTSGNYIHFFSPFWGFYALRWHVLEDATWLNFRSKLESCLLEIGLSPHYPPEKHATCTALNLGHEINPNELAKDIFPIPLFRARKMVISRIIQRAEFEILGTFNLA
jgi:hypothetical protein